MSISRKIAALRALAERPGTEAEGRVARAKLAELEARAARRDPYDAFRDYLRSGSMECARRADLLRGRVASIDGTVGPSGA